MLASIPERIAAAVQDALLAEPVMIEVAARVERAREDAFSREEIVDGAINIRSGDERTRRHSDDVDDNELDIDIEINVRAGDVWETAADAIAVQVHARVKTWAYTGIAIAVISKAGRSPKGEGGDYTPGQLTLTYTFRYLTLADDVTAQP
jgi:hypothetical protein